jgi:hypothetical protein
MWPNGARREKERQIVEVGRGRARKWRTLNRKLFRDIVDEIADVGRYLEASR